jgi:2-methylisocitrate lyase-like PEP mutase family enzyme
MPRRPVSQTGRAGSGFLLVFMSGFAVSDTRLGLSDICLISYGEIVEQGRNIYGAVSIPLIGDGETGFGTSVECETYRRRPRQRQSRLRCDRKIK